MTISRSVATRLAEGVWTLLKADADLIALCVSATTGKPRIYLGLNGLTPNTIVPPQIHVIATPDGTWSPGPTGAGKSLYRVRVYYFEQNPFSRDPEDAGGGTGNALDVMIHIEKLLWMGSDGAGRGGIYDPDDVTAPYTYINTTIEDMTLNTPEPTGGDGAIAWPLDIDFGVNELNTTRERR